APLRLPLSRDSLRRLLICCHARPRGLSSRHRQKRRRPIRPRQGENTISTEAVENHAAIGQRQALSARALQYSQARDSGPGDRLLAAASLVSPGVNGPKLPSASVRIWYSAFWHMAIERNTSSRTLAPTTVAPCRRISTAQCGPRARASERPSSCLTTSRLVSPNSSR